MGTDGDRGGQRGTYRFGARRVEGGDSVRRREKIERRREFAWPNGAKGAVGTGLELRRGPRERGRENAQIGSAATCPLQMATVESLNGDCREGEWEEKAQTDQAAG